MNSQNGYYQKKTEEIVNKEFPTYIKMLESCFDFAHWGFHLIFAGDVLQSNPSIVYESNFCRVRFLWEIPDSRDSSEFTYILYGRLHAPVNQRVITWAGEECYCWHEIHRALEFLDGFSPQEAFKRRFKLPPVMYEFHEANKDKDWRQSEFQARIHSAVWKSYGQQLFHLFDLHNPKLWGQYADFLKEYYQLWPDYFARPTIDKIC